MCQSSNRFVIDIILYMGFNCGVQNRTRKSEQNQNILNEKFKTEPENFGWGSLFLFIQWILGSFVLILFLRQLSTSRKRITIGGWGIQIFDWKVLNFLELQIELSKILMVLNLFCCEILCMYLCLRISISKICHIVINIFFDCFHPAWCCS